MWGSSGEPWSFWFHEDPGGYTHAFHVVRSQFDDILLRHAERQGAEVREGMTVEAIDGEGPFVVTARGEDGQARARRGRATSSTRAGKTPSSDGASGLREFNPFFKNLALWSYFADAARMPEPRIATTSSPRRTARAGAGTSRSTTAP